MAVYFGNTGLIDLDVIRIMGVSIKTADNPIGYFGTGLKFAISTLLRTGHKVTLMRGIESYEFSIKQKEVRGQSVNQVYMNDEALPFTTQLGKNWQVWMAYRELHSNTLDEGGEVSDRPITADTVFIVEGDEFQHAYNIRSTIFIDSPAIAENARISVHFGTSGEVYYRGVRAGKMPNGSKFSYNIKESMNLSEDRMFASQWDVEWKLQTLIPEVANEAVAVSVLEDTNGFDSSLDFSYCANPSDAFSQVAARLQNNLNANPAAAKVAEKHMQSSGSFPRAELTAGEAARLSSAFPKLLNMRCDLYPDEVEVCETLGPDVFGAYHKAKDQIFLARAALDMGDAFIVATLYEEWLHKRHGFKDKTRALQNFLFHKLVSVANDMPEKPATDFLEAKELPF